MKATTSSRFALGSIAMAALAALFAFAVAMPTNAQAMTYSWSGDTITYVLQKGDKVKLDKHDASDNVVVKVDGTSTVSGSIGANDLSFVTDKTTAVKLTVSGSVNANRIYIESQSDWGKPFAVNFTGTRVTADNHFDVRCSTAIIKTKYGLKVGEDFYAYFSDVYCTPTGKSSATTGIYCGSVLIANQGSHVEATGYYRGIDVPYLGVLNISSVKGKASKTTTLASGKYAYGIKTSTILATGRSTVKGYAYAGIKTFSKTKPRSFGVFVDDVCSLDGSVYAYNKGKYGVGFACADATINNGYCDEDVINDYSTKAYAKNYGIGILIKDWGKGLDHGLKLERGYVTSYGGKYGIYGEGGDLEATDSCLLVYGKNLKGTRTGHGVYLKDGGAYFLGSSLNVYAKNSKSYYGVYATGHNAYVGARSDDYSDSDIFVYGYSSKAFCFKDEYDGTVQKGFVIDSYICVNGKPQTNYPGSEA